ncbi:hypothetical protein [Bradyrhizobium icense]|nr:hypothetical protein [Bradyrhizobium icense]
MLRAFAALHEFVMVVYAAKHGETALDGDSLNSPFATVLVRVVREPRIEVQRATLLRRAGTYCRSLVGPRLSSASP